MKSNFISVGYGNVVALHRIVSVVSPLSSPIKRLREEAAANQRLIDATQGRRTRAIIILDTNHVVLSALQPETLLQRLNPEYPAEKYLVGSEKSPV